MLSLNDQILTWPDWFPLIEQRLLQVDTNDWLKVVDERVLVWVWAIQECIEIILKAKDLNDAREKIEEYLQNFINNLPSIN
jgi:hypothetical protein